MIILDTNGEIDLEKIADSGQCFRWIRLGKQEYLIPAFGQALRARLTEGRLELDCDEASWRGVWRIYFDMDTDYARIREAIDPEDAYLTRAAEKGKGIRLLRQDAWETTASFLISQNNNIPRIKGCVERLCALASFPCFPTPGQVLESGRDALNGMGLGYRAEYLWKNAEWFAGMEDPQTFFGRYGYENARRILKDHPGIGGKVADCICLFSLGYRDAFPVDTWIRRVVNAHYGGRFPAEKYPGCAGILQQYMFYAERS